MKKYLFLLVFLVANKTMAQTNFADTKGELTVSGSGTPNYKVPIALPPGIMQVAPQIALTYSGASVHGMAGMGWDLVGISSISRVAPRLDLDGEILPVNYTATDRFMLDGQRLVLRSDSPIKTYGAAGATYQTENYSNLKIESSGSFAYAGLSNPSGPQNFTLTFSDGSQAFYGTTADSRGLSEWMINRWIDAQGNYIDYTYTTENNAIRITKITWGKNTNSGSTYQNTIDFVYKSRSRAEFSYTHGIKVGVAKMLESITVTTGGAQFRKYVLTHDVLSGNYQRVKQVQEFNAANEPANPVEFTYNTTADSFSDFSYSNFDSGFNLDDVIDSGDIDGDGSMDFIAKGKIYLNPFSTDGSKKELVIDNQFLGLVTVPDASGKLVQKSQLIKFAVVGKNEIAVTLQSFKNNSTTEFNVNTHTKKVSSLFIETHRNYCNIDVLIPPGMPQYSIEQGVSGEAYATFTDVKQGDFNGDGITEVFVNYSITVADSDIVGGTNDQMLPRRLPSELDEPHCVTNYNTYYRSAYIDLNPANDSSKVYGINLKGGDIIADFNGDGKQDIFRRYGQSYQIYTLKNKADGTAGFEEYISGTIVENMDSFTVDKYPGRIEKVVVFGDFNGDGKTDFMVPVANESADWAMYMATGTGFERIFYPNFEWYQPFWEGSPSRSTRVSLNYSAVDFNKDGKSDFVVAKYESWRTSVEDYKNRDAKANCAIKMNTGNGSLVPSFDVRLESPFVYSKYGYSDMIRFVTGNFKNHQTNRNIAFTQGDRFWKGNFNRDIEGDARLLKVSEAGGALQQTLTYSPLTPSATNAGLGSVNDVYYSTNSEQYPFTEIRNVPTMKVVSQLTATGAGQTKKQDFKYASLVTHSQGLGILGFKKTARSSWYNDANPNKIWNITITSPQLNGAVVKEFTATNYTVGTTIENYSPTTGTIQPSTIEHSSAITTAQTSIASKSIVLKPGFSAVGSKAAFTAKIDSSIPVTAIADNATTGNYLSRKDYMYSKTQTQNKIYTLQLQQTNSKDLVTGVNTQENYSYDTYNNIDQKTVTNGVSTKTIAYTYTHNLQGVGKNYYLGRVVQKSEKISAYGDTFGTEENLVYNANNLLSQSIKKGNTTDAITETYTYDVYGNLLTKTIAAPGVASRVIQDTYDANGRFVIQKKNHEKLLTKFEYNNWGMVTKTTSPQGIVNTTIYDNWGKVTSNSTTGAASGVQATTTAYNRFSGGGFEIVATNSGTGEVSRSLQDVYGRTVKTSTKGFASGTWVSKVIEYDFLGRKVKESEPFFDASPSIASGGTQWNTTTYDYLSRPIEQLSYTGRKQSLNYNLLTATVTDGPKTIVTTLDANQNKIQVQDNTEIINFTFYANGTPKETKYGTHVIITKQDGWGRKIYLFDPSAGTTPYTYTYNNYGELLTETTPTGTTTFTYDTAGLGRLVKKEVKGQRTDIVTNYTYNAYGMITDESGTSEGKTFAYNYKFNTYWQLESKTESTPNNLTHKKTFVYDSQGRVLQENTNSFLTNNTAINNGNITVQYGYNTYNGILQQITDTGSNTVLWKLNTANEKMQLLTATLGNGMQITNVYDAYSYLKTSNHTAGSNTALNLTYNFKADRGLLNSRKNEIAGIMTWNESFSYDSFERLTNWTDPTGTASNAYSADGRITTNNQVGSYNYKDNSNRYKKTSASLNETGLAYYQNRSVQSVEYNMFKNATQITETNRGKVTFEFDLGQSRSASTVYNVAGTITKNKYYSSDNEVEVTEKPGQSLQFVTYLDGSPYTANIVLQKTYSIAGNTYTPVAQEFLYLHRDYQGTILAISGNGGVVKERRQFDPWGNLKKHYKNEVLTPPSGVGGLDFEFLLDRGYTGHEHFFNVGIIHMNGRIYDPVLRTFLSPDPYIQDPENSQNYNRYAYAFNNPLLYSDPSGNFIVELSIGAAILIGALIGGVVYTGVALYNGNFSWGGLAKSIIVGAISGAATSGIGSIAADMGKSICVATQTLTQTQVNLIVYAAQGVMHGVAQGVIQGVSGNGSFGQNFITAAASSIAASAYGGFVPKANSGVGKLLFSTVAGGTTSALQGGNFWQGAGMGFTIALLNHLAHEIDPPTKRERMAERLGKTYQSNKNQIMAESLVSEGLLEITEPGELLTKFRENFDKAYGNQQSHDVNDVYSKGIEVVKNLKDSFGGGKITDLMLTKASAGIISHVLYLSAENGVISTSIQYLDKNAYYKYVAPSERPQGGGFSGGGAGGVWYNLLKK
jgi:RHS repeat-associated protein